jgi:AcrR family transcriptional regulator
LERLVRASLEILEAGGTDGLTVQAIVARAGSSVGSFYARFAGKDELLDYLGERAWREAATRWDETLLAREWGERSLAEMIEGSVHLLGEAGRSRAAYLSALKRTPGAQEDAYLAFQAHVIEGVEQLLLERAAEMTHPDPAKAVPLGLRAALALLDGPPAPGEAPPPPEERMAEAARLLSAYLACDATRAGASGDVDFFDIWG